MPVQCTTHIYGHLWILFPSTCTVHSALFLRPALQCLYVRHRESKSEISAGAGALKQLLRVGGDTASLPGRFNLSLEGDVVEVWAGSPDRRTSARRRPNMIKSGRCRCRTSLEAKVLGLLYRGLGQSFCESTSRTSCH